ncbi:MAG: carboxypeptidase-like regulatory domain-containing protein [Saprospiraceae bacterium]|nr:carboxypeptidase-like regulatory domain-containing protein [Saprospiraceae bacterium]
MKQLFVLLGFAFLPISLFAQLTGVVSDENNEPLPFASVYVKNSTNGTAANAKGEYKLTLKPGTYDIVFQYIGYQQKTETVAVGAKGAVLDVQMIPADLEITEVTITTEDPAYAIMRKVIERRKYYKNLVRDYSCDVYVKGFHKLMDAPEKILGQEVGNMGGILDTNRTGVLYLSESVSKLYVQSQPARSKEVMISSKVSGGDNGFSLNRATLTEFSLYDEKINIDRDILSPLADNAFTYYRFRLVGKYEDNNQNKIYKIEVLPKRPADPTFFGHLYVVDNLYNLAGADVALTGDAIKQPILDTLRFVQEYVPVAEPDKWALLSQITTFKFGVLGFDIEGLFTTVSSNYDLNPVFEERFFNKEVFKIENEAGKRDSTYWSSVRPVPLTMEESVDYVRKDSLQLIWKSEAYMDSMDRKNNKFKPLDVLMGYTWQNSFNRTSISYPSVFEWVQFNSVQGLVFNVEPTFSRYSEDRDRSYWQGKGILNYGFSEDRFRYGIELERRFEGIHYTTLELSGGVLPVQFNPVPPISLALNSAYTLFNERNYMKLYEKAFGRVQFSRRYPGVFLRGYVEYGERRPLVNNTDYTWQKKAEDREYSPNAPTTDGVEPAFETHQALVAQVEMRFRFGETYSTYPNFRSYSGSRWPELWLRYRKAIPGVFGSDVNLDFVQANIKQDDLSWGLAGYTEWHVSAGVFLNRNRVEFMDRYMPLGNQTNFSDPTHIGQGYFLLPYYDYATDKAFFKLHAQHHLQGWLFDKIPGVRRLNFKEVFGVNVYYANETAKESLDTTRDLPYWEVNFGIENLGFGVFRGFRIDVASGFFGKDYYRTAVLLSMAL